MPSVPRPSETSTVPKPSGTGEAARKTDAHLDDAAEGALADHRVDDVAVVELLGGLNDVVVVLVVVAVVLADALLLALAILVLLALLQLALLLRRIVPLRRGNESVSKTLASNQDASRAKLHPR